MLCEVHFMARTPLVSRLSECCVLVQEGGCDPLHDRRTAKLPAALPTFWCVCSGHGSAAASLRGRMHVAWLSQLVCALTT